MNLSEKICPVCKTANEHDAVVCKHCGATLADSDSSFKTKTTDMQALTPELIQEWAAKAEKETAVPDKGIAFYVDGHSMPAYIDSKAEFVLGRKDETTSKSLLDLAPFGGYSLGLSRQHALIRQTAEGYEVLDLGSVNGSYLNEQRLVPHTAYPLPSGSHLRLARMRLLVLYRPSPATDQKQ